MARNQEIKFKPYIGLFFKFRNDEPAIGKRVFGNELRGKIKLEPLPDTFLIVDEKRNYVRFLDGLDGAFWTRKTHIEPVKLPTHAESILPVLQGVREFLVYCTQSKIKDFHTEVMAKMASDLLPKIDVLIDKNRLKIIPKE